MDEIKKLASDFEKCQKILQALGDANRQHMILEMMKLQKCTGVRVNEITEKSNLSRPSVSHHLKRGWYCKDAKRRYKKLLLF